MAVVKRQWNHLPGLTLSFLRSAINLFDGERDAGGSSTVLAPPGLGDVGWPQWELIESEICCTLWLTGRTDKSIIVLISFHNCIVIIICKSEQGEETGLDSYSRWGGPVAH